jgi:hypothetical protein
MKDRLEDRLHALVCAGKMSLEEAQHAIGDDWIAAYQRYVSPEPLARSARRLDASIAGVVEPPHLSAAAPR